ncbi:RNA-directed DNA polymerase from mobile element jockey [Exaiptasia diaphana]|nr:RNA-directed DNA polymerase from mobile element jockey [Exaiptasia diaphana]
MSVFTPLDAPVLNTSTNSHLEDFPRPVSELSVIEKLSSLNPNKASGPDGIPAWVLRDNADILAAPVTDILNTSFRERRVPSSWKSADITPLPKTSPVTDVNKHLRPISLTPILSKVGEELIIDGYIKPAILAKIDKNQYGTIPNSNTTLALISMLHSWYKDTDGNGSTVRVVLFDFKKAFDLIDHSILMTKLQDYDLSPWVLDWIASFLTDRKQPVKLSHDCFSEWGSVKAGVPQGTKLGPWLFLVMINDIDVSSVNLWKYVDDTSIVETVHKGQPSEIQVAVDELVEQVQADKFQLNESKCKELQIHFSRNANTLEPVTINNKPIEVVPSAKLLGLTISNNLKWNAHIENVTKKCASRLYQLRQLKRANAVPDQLMCFYKTCIRPVTEYACQTFHDGLPRYLSEELETIQRRALKIISPALNYEQALNEHSMTTLHQRRKDLTEQLFKEINDDSNHKLRGREGQRGLRPDSFRFSESAEGEKYVEMTHDEATKNHPGGILDHGTDEKEGRMYATSDPEDG